MRGCGREILMEPEVLEKLYAAGDRLADDQLIAEIYTAAIHPDLTPEQALETIRKLVDARIAGQTRRMQAGPVCRLLHPDANQVRNKQGTGRCIEVLPHDDGTCCRPHNAGAGGNRNGKQS